jgi:hypothetical protein
VDDTAEVSETAAKVDVVGNVASLEEQLLLKAIEVRRDLEYSVASGQIVKRTDPREMAGLQSFAGNASMGLTATLPTGDGLTAPVAGTARYISIDILNTVMSAGWAVGARYGMAVTSMLQKLLFDSLVPAEQQLATPQVSVTGTEGVPLVTTVSRVAQRHGAGRVHARPGVRHLRAGAQHPVLPVRQPAGIQAEAVPAARAATGTASRWPRSPAPTGRRSHGKELIEVPNPMAIAFIGDLKTV